MTQFFIGLYDYFERHKILFYLSLISCVLLMGFFALQVRFEENITQFFPDTKDSQNTIKVFDNLKIKDYVILGRYLPPRRTRPPDRSSRTTATNPD